MSASPAVADARARLAAERQRWSRAAQPRQLPPPDAVWRPTPTRRECDLKAATPGAVTLTKLWDRSPIQADQSWDPTQPPSELPPPPVNTAPPTVVELSTLTPGEVLVCNPGSWSGSGNVYTRVWRRDGASIAGATAATYTMVDEDVGSMVGCTVTATNAGGSASADAAEVGPVLPASPLRRRRNT
jgi:hypothetical protein